MNVDTAIQRDRAVRSFRDEPLDTDTVLTLIGLAREAGSSKNRQPWDVLVVDERAVLDELASHGAYTTPMTEAPAAIALLADSTTDRRRYAVNAFDYGRFVQNLMLAATARGLGTVPQGIDTTPEVRELLDLDDATEVFLLIAIGWPTEEQADTIEGEDKASVLADMGRRDVADITHWRRYGQSPPTPDDGD